MTPRNQPFSIKACFLGVFEDDLEGFYNKLKFKNQCYTISIPLYDEDDSPIVSGKIKFENKRAVMIHGELSSNGTTVMSFTFNYTYNQYTPELPVVSTPAI